MQSRTCRFWRRLCTPPQDHGLSPIRVGLLHLSEFASDATRSVCPTSADSTSLQLNEVVHTSAWSWTFSKLRRTMKPTQIQKFRVPFASTDPASNAARIRILFGGQSVLSS